MNDVLKSFPLALIFRGVFPGCFFVLAFLAATLGWEKMQFGFAEQPATYSILAVLSGVTIYTIHRAVIYPVIEHGHIYGWKEARKTWRETLSFKADSHWAFIGTKTVQTLIDRWKIGATNEKTDMKKVVQNISDWGDYCHMHYTSAWCIAAGSCVGAVFTSKSRCDLWLIFLFALLLFCAYVSDCRLRAVYDELLKDQPKKASQN